MPVASFEHDVRSDSLDGDTKAEGFWELLLPLCLDCIHTVADVSTDESYEGVYEEAELVAVVNDDDDDDTEFDDDEDDEDDNAQEARALAARCAYLESKLSTSRKLRIKEAREQEKDRLGPRPREWNKIRVERCRRKYLLKAFQSLPGIMAVRPEPALHHFQGKTQMQYVNHARQRLIKNGGAGGPMEALHSIFVLAYITPGLREQAKVELAPFVAKATVAQMVIDNVPPCPGGLNRLPSLVAHLPSLHLPTALPWDRVPEGLLLTEKLCQRLSMGAAAARNSGNRSHLPHLGKYLPLGWSDLVPQQQQQQQQQWPPTQLGGGHHPFSVHLRRRISTTAHNEVVSKSYSDCLQAANTARAAAHAAEKATKRQLRREEECRGMFEDRQAAIAAHLSHRLDAEDREEERCEWAAKRAKSSHNKGFYNEGPAPLEGEFLAKLNRHLPGLDKSSRPYPPPDLLNPATHDAARSYVGRSYAANHTEWNTEEHWAGEPCNAHFPLHLTTEGPGWIWRSHPPGGQIDNAVDNRSKSTGTGRSAGRSNCGSAADIQLRALLQ